MPESGRAILLVGILGSIMSNTSASLRRLFRGGAAFGVLSLAMGAAVAQTPTQPVDTVVDCDPNTAGVQTNCAPDQQDRVVITGSRIARDAFTSTSPIQVITSEQSTLEGLVDTSEMIQGSSIAQGSLQLNNQFGGFVVEGGPGINSISLRGLGAQRSLILLNGQRPGPAGVRGQVAAFDLQVIPDSIISRVEILKDGASSVYGSDAVAGVVNIITRSSVDSPELNVQYNATEGGGGNTFQINGAMGFELFGGNVMLAAEYEVRDPLEFGDRSYLACSQDLAYDATTGKRVDRIDESILKGTSLANCPGNIYFNTVIVGATRYIPSPDGVTIGPIAGYRPRTNRTFDCNTGVAGTQRPPSCGGVLPAVYAANGFNAYYEDVLNDERFLNSHAIAGVDRLSLYGRADFQLDMFGGIDWTTEALFNRREYESERVRQFFPTIAPNAGYDVPGTFGGLGNSPFGGLATPITIWPSNNQVDVDYVHLGTQFTGDFMLPGWTWSLNAGFSSSDGEYRGNAIRIETAGDWNFARPSDGLYAAPNYNPFDPNFLSGNYSDAVYDLLTANTVGSTTYEQTLVQGVVSGDLFELPAGPLGVAIGAEWRNFEIDDTPDPRASAGEFWGQTSAGRTTGEDTVSEAFIEANIPLLRGLPFIEELTVDASARAFDYDSYGNDSVWKAGLNWQVIPSVRVRGTTGTSYRAPALYELFLANQTGFLGQLAIDPCDQWDTSTNPNIVANCGAAGIPAGYNATGSSALIVTGGGAGVLEAETSEANTLGLIWTPDFIDFSLAIDYFDITINDQVSQLGAGAILGGCYGSPNYPNAFCNLFTRAPNSDPSRPNQIIQVNDSYINVNSQSTAGIDITARYEHEFDFGNLVVDLSATHTTEDVVNLFDPSLASGFDTSDFNGSLGDPEWVGDASIQLRQGDWTYSWFVDYIGEMDHTPFAAELAAYQGLTIRRINKTDEWFSHDVSVRYRGDNFVVTGGVGNVFNATPPVITSGVASRFGNTPAFASQYDLRGRTFFLRLGYEF
jgi:iron complex outermembrane recepter protein